MRQGRAQITKCLQMATYLLVSVAFYLAMWFVVSTPLVHTHPIPNATPALSPMLTHTPQTRMARYNVHPPVAATNTAHPAISAQNAEERRVFQMADARWTGKKFLDNFVDDGLEVNMAWLPLPEAKTQVERLLPEVAIARLVIHWPGRLPEKAGRDARSSDKNTARRVETRLWTAASRWSIEKTSLELPDWKPNKPNKARINRDIDETITFLSKTDEIRQKAAQMDWFTWWQAHREELSMHMRRVATNAKGTGQVKAGNRMLSRFANEFSSLDEVLGMLQKGNSDDS